MNVADAMNEATVPLSQRTSLRVVVGMLADRRRFFLALSRGLRKHGMPERAESYRQGAADAMGFIIMLTRGVHPNPLERPPRPGRCLP